MDRIKENSYVFPTRVGDVKCKEKSLTQQQFANEVDVNTIVARAIKTGLLGDPMSIIQRQAVFGDFSGVGSYQDCLNRVIAAQGAFDALPANVRARFDNDPAKLIAFVNDPKNFDEAVELGLAVKKDVADKVAAEAAKLPEAGAPAAPAA